jgi:hypothetical protein
VTHPLLFLVALASGGVCFGASWLLSGPGSDAPIFAASAGGGLVLASIFVLGIASGYFTRLVVTNFRLVILQGFEICRSWDKSDLPRSLIRYGMVGTDMESPTIDLDALNTMLGVASDKVADSKTILAFGKQLDHIKAARNNRP